MDKVFDLIVIGAGINGVGVGKLAAESGLKVLLLEQYAKPALATSSKSSKLVHGGLRYLESGELHFVYKSLKERRHLLADYPELVKLKPFFIPVYKQSKRSRLTIFAGLFLYFILGGFRKENRFRCLSKKEYHSLDGLKTTELKAVFQYYDAQTDDAKLTETVLDEAVVAGAEVKFLHQIQSIHLGENISVIQCENGFSAKAKAVVNASGPWVNVVLDKVAPAPKRIEVDLVQGAHIVVPGGLEAGFYYLEARTDGRAVFVMPWHDNILIGTTEKLHTTDPVLVASSDVEAEYLLAVFNDYFPDRKIVKQDILEKMAGLRVLPKSETSIFGRSREVKLKMDRESKPRLLSIYGGKLTSWHSTASAVLRQLSQ